MERRRAGWKEIALLIGSTIGAALLLEAFARAWVAVRWPEERVQQMTLEGSYRGRFEIAPPQGYSLRPSYRSVVDGKVFTHNSLGFRGDEFPRDKPAGQIRIALMGASTVYGLTVSDGDTGSAVLQRNLQTMLPGADIFVINAAVPGWLTGDSVQSLQQRVLPLDPDMIVVMEGRNEAWPQAFDEYRDDYGHYMTRDTIAIASVQSAQRALFRWSSLMMILAHRAPGLFDYRAELFFPIYARVHFENAPTAEQVVRFAGEESRFGTYRNNLIEIVERARERGVIPVLATIHFDASRYESDLLPRTPEALAAERRMVLRNIDITREVARDRSVLLFDGYALTTPDLMFDDCHPNERGEEIFGRALAEVIAPQLRERTGR